MKTIGVIAFFFLLSTSLAGQETNLYQSIVKRNALNLTESAPIKTLPPAADFLAPDIYLTGISRFSGTNKVHLVVRKRGEPDKFVSLVENQTQNGVQLKKIGKNSASITSNGQHKLLSFEKHSLPTTFTKVATSKLTQMNKNKKSEWDEKRRRDK